MDSRGSFSDCLFMLVQHRATSPLSIQVSGFDPVRVEFED